MFVTHIVLCILYAMIIGAVDCFPRKSTLSKLSINNSQNATGHWNSKIQFEHGAIYKQGSPLDLKLEQAIVTGERDDFVLITANFTVPPRFTLPEDYELIPDVGYYKLHKELQDWHTARVICKKEGAHLAIINSHLEYSIMKMLFNRNPKLKNYAFVGISDLQKHKNFVTIFDEPLNATGYTNWHPTEPNYNGNCVVVERTGQFHDTGCQDLFPFFCEKEL